MVRYGTVVHTDDGSVNCAVGGAIVRKNEGSVVRTDDGTVSFRTDNGNIVCMNDETAVRADDGTRPYRESCGTPCRRINNCLDKKSRL